MLLRYYVSYQHPADGLEPTDGLKTAFFIDTSLIQLSHWVQSRGAGVGSSSNVEELVIINQGWSDADFAPRRKNTAGWHVPDSSTPRHMIMPSLRRLKVAGCLPDICLLFDFLTAPNLEYMEVMAFYGGDVDTDENIEEYYDLVDAFQEQCGSIREVWVIITQKEPESYGEICALSEFLESILTVMIATQILDLKEFLRHYRQTCQGDYLTAECQYGVFTGELGLY
ncbi:hypothetical protein D9756_006794 [Leucocoprinus leucothites]|uniref:Uncharacterized protein n=1 Tax=Leucocoprinus leucothites TaxID=201217 RepID=A0A8H5G2E6_9AGAR|nr:hypothetical protein D9756_006794 [Leucoagaricus leucothites]